MAMDILTSDYIQRITTKVAAGGEHDTSVLLTAACTQNCQCSAGIY